jgi:hypothetical protein
MLELTFRRTHEAFVGRPLPPYCRKGMVMGGRRESPRDRGRFRSDEIDGGGVRVRTA